MKPLALTGLGLTTPLGTGRASFLAALREGQSSAFAPPSHFDASAYAGALVAELRGFDPAAVVGDKGLRNLDRLTRLFLVAARTALEDAGLKSGGAWTAYAGPEVGVAASTAYGSLETMMELHRVTLLESPRYLNPGKFPNTVINSALGYVSIWEDLRGPNATVCNGNCGALDAILCAETFLSSGRARAMLVGGAEALHEALYLAFDRLGSIATTDRVYAPGEERSNGMRLGEAAALMLLEDAEDAKRRGAKSRCEVVGYGTSFEPPDSEALLVHADADAVERAIKQALADAHLDASAIGLVFGSADGVPLYDRAEGEALRRVFGEGIPVVLPKAIVGETLGAGGAVNLAFACAHFEGAPLPIARGAAPVGVQEHVLVLALGFYGNASAVVLRRT